MPLPTDLVELARRFSLLGDPTRLQIARLLVRGEKYVGEIAELTGVNPPAISQHLRLLRQAGLVSKRKQGHRAFYSASSEWLRTLLRES